MRHLRMFLLPAALIVATVGVPVEAQEEGPAPTEIQSLAAESDGTMLSVSGTVDWGGTAPAILGEDPTGDAPGGANRTEPLGLDVTAISAWVEDGDVPEATFAWDVTTFDQPPPPELVRYYWEWQVGGLDYALQAKTSDFASGANIADSPEGVAANLASYAEHIVETGTLPEFRLRGNCGTIAIISYCTHVDWITGAFDTDNNQIRIHLPLDSEATPSIRPGATIAPTTGAWASLQAVADNAATRDTVSQEFSWTIPSSRATASLQDLDGLTVAQWVLTTDGGEVSGSQDMSGLAPGTYTLEVTACFGGNCDTGTALVTI